MWVLAIDSLAMEWIPEAMPGVARAGHTARLDLIPVQATLPEVYDPDASPGSRWSSLAAPRRYQYYPFTFVLPSGDVFLAGPQTDSYRLDLDTPQWSSALWANIWTWSAAMYRPGKIVKIGGTGGNGYDTAHIEFNASNSTSGWSQANTDLVHRYLPQLTILPDGRLIATGGVREPKANRVPMRKPQIWSPPTGGFPVGTWGDTLAADPAARDHHSTAILLPDGRVLTAGVSDLELVDSDKATIFCPPYLFLGDSLVTRPVITAAPDSIIWGRPFSVTSPQAGDSLVAALVRPSAVTHSFNQNQLYVPLVFRENESGRDLVLDAPVGGTYAPPGDYMLFLLDAAGVPSIASWVRVRDEPGDESCADVAPAAVTLSAPEVGRHSIKLTWTAPGENGACGTAEAYDVRRSSSTITEANFYAATPVTANLPAPSETETEQCMEVDFLSSCTTYRFAIRTRDAEGVWSWISNSVTAQTACSGNMEVLCDGGGLLVGGGGGGGEEGLRGGFALAASTPTLLEASEVAARENSLLHAGDEAGLDLIALPQGEVAGDERVIVHLRPAGDWAAEIDVLALGVIDHDRALVAVPDAERVLLGTIAPLAGANALRSGEALLSLPGASTTTALVIESRAPAPRPGESAATILVQVDDGASWRTVSVVRPRRAFDRRAIAIGAVESVRLVLSGECSIRTLERMEVAESRVIEPLDLVEAHGERSEEIAAGLGEAGGTEARLEPGEHTSLVFDAPARDPELRRSSFLLARGRLVATGSAASMATTRAGADPAQEFVFALGSARPNPGPGPVTIEYSLARRTQLDLRLYSVTGRLVRTLVREERPAGPGVVVWDGRDDHGKEAEPGAYFCRMTADEWQSGRKLVIVRR